MSDAAIKVEGLGKRFTIGKREAYKTIRETITTALAAPVRMLQRKQEDPETTLWALKDVNFEVQRGEAIGIIGRNGAGKSTLLKVLSRITEPTLGQITINGRIGSLLEVGTGFHPELSGRENIYMNGAILGMRRSEIVRKFDEIVAFAEVDRFIDTPVKRYSSGMYTRLAFAVAAHLEPEILIVDEVLAVGDVQFQKKCLGKMGEVAHQGRTVLFVSHNMGAIEQLTRKCVVLKKGNLIFYGPSTEAISNYTMANKGSRGNLEEVENVARRTPGLSGQVKFLRMNIANESGIVSEGEPIRFRLIVRAQDSIPSFRFSMTIFRADGSPVGSFFGAEMPAPGVGQDAEFLMELDNHNLAPGLYHCGLATGSGDLRTGHKDFDVVLDVMSFEVAPPEGSQGTAAYWTQGWGSIRFQEPRVVRVG